MDKTLSSEDFNLIKNMWAQKGQLATMGFNIRQEFLETEQKISSKVGEVDSELGIFIKTLRTKHEVPVDWKLDLSTGAFVSPEQMMAEQSA
tara:strand:- start:5005 stop:5277 length:273 start_codon:yes stop_codon:yes gene_type:complete